MGLGLETLDWDSGLTFLKKLDLLTLQEVNNHPVHILNKNGSLSPSSFIPFCSFGKNLLLVGTKIEEFDFPICNIFTPKVLNNQLCYETDLAKLKDTSNIVQQYEMGLVLILDYNEDKQFNLDKNYRKEKYRNKTVNLIERRPGSHLVTIYFDTISKCYLQITTLYS